MDAAAGKVGAIFGHLNVLVNNAGVYSEKQPTRDALRDSLAVNVISAASTTNASLPLLRKSSKPRLVFVTSVIGSLTHSSDTSSRHYGPYANKYWASKAAVNMLMVQYAGPLGQDGVAMLSADPRFCATNLTGNPNALRQMGAAEPEVRGKIVASVVKGERDTDAGRVCDLEGVCPW